MDRRPSLVLHPGPQTKGSVAKHPLSFGARSLLVTEKRLCCFANRFHSLSSATFLFSIITYWKTASMSRSSLAVWKEACSYIPWPKLNKPSWLIRSYDKINSSVFFGPDTHFCFTFLSCSYCGVTLRRPTLTVCIQWTPLTLPHLCTGDSAAYTLGAQLGRVYWRGPFWRWLLSVAFSALKKSCGCTLVCASLWPKGSFSDKFRKAAGDFLCVWLMQAPL